MWTTKKALAVLFFAYCDFSSVANGFSYSKSGRQASNGEITSSRRNFIQTASFVAGAAILFPQKSSAFEVGGKIVLGDESIMNEKAHGTSNQPVQSDLLYGVSDKLADRICSFNRHFAERGGYFLTTNFEDAVLEAKGPVTFYDSVTGKPLFVAPINRSADAFLKESEIHGWPSFRDEEVSAEISIIAFLLILQIQNYQTCSQFSWPGCLGKCEGTEGIG
jgi:hypothetical protein